MKKLAHVVLRFYPRVWRTRYGDEMHALLDQHRVSVRTVFDLVIRAIHAHLFWEHRGIWRTQFLAGTAALSFVCMSTYTGVQQWMRVGANQPQQTIVNNMTAALSTGQALTPLLPHTVVDVKSSLDPFVIVYDQKGAPIASTVRLNGRTPQLPSGVLDYARKHGRDALTWQPGPDARIAAVVEPYGGTDGGFVLSGRALRVVENQETLALRITGGMWAILVTSFTILLAFWNRHRNRPTPAQS